MGADVLKMAFILIGRQESTCDLIVRKIVHFEWWSNPGVLYRPIRFRTTRRRCRRSIRI